MSTEQSSSLLKSLPPIVPTVCAAAGWRAWGGGERFAQRVVGAEQIEARSDWAGRSRCRHQERDAGGGGKKSALAEKRTLLFRVHQRSSLFSKGKPEHFEVANQPLPLCGIRMNCERMSRKFREKLRRPVNGTNEIDFYCNPGVNAGVSSHDHATGPVYVSYLELQRRVRSRGTADRRR